MDLIIDEKVYSNLLKQNLPSKISTDEEYNHWAGILEHIEFDKSAAAEYRELANPMMDAMGTHDRTRHPEQFASDPLGMLNYAIAQTSMTQAALAPLLGVSTAYANQICHGKRGISLLVAHQRAQRFKLNSLLEIVTARLKAQSVASPTPNRVSNGFTTLTNP